MDTERLSKWADLLLDTGKRNSLINFKDSKLGTAEIVAPNFNTLFEKAEHSAVFEVYDPKLDDDEDELDLDEDSEQQERQSKQSYIAAYAGKLKRNQILVYNVTNKPIQALKNIGKKARTAVEETGVNIAYLAFGFIHWTESESSQIEMRAPILLAPIAIENHSAVEPYYIKVLDDELIVNPTFTYKLQNEYGIKLPEYDEDDGIEKYLGKVTVLLARLKWTVTTECKIGIFSFLKINMYKDLKENTAKIARNSSVRALLGESSSLGATSSEGIKVSDLLALHNVVDADSSQAEAIETAKEGKSFVLQGPPGTGKSQTITNIIAECLMDGKKVLFVSEKLAALNVVYDKLKKVGLEEFCLELHSHKANKKQVIEELCRTLRLQKSGVSDKAERELRIKQEAQRQLDAYAVELHKIRPNINKTLYQLYEEVSACRSANDISFVIQNIKEKGENYIDTTENLLARYTGYIDSIGSDYHKNIWYGYINTDSSYQTVMLLKEDLQAVITLCRSLLEINEGIKANYGISSNCINDAFSLNSFFELAGRSDFITPSLFSLTVLEEVKQTVNRLHTMAKHILQIKATLDEVFDEDLYKLAGQVLYKKLTKQYIGWLSHLFSGEYKHIINDIKICKQDGKKIKYADAVSAIDTLCKYQNSIKEFAEQESEIKILLGKAYIGANTDFEKLLSELDILTSAINGFKEITQLAHMPAEIYSSNKMQFKQTAEKYSRMLTANKEHLERLLASFNIEEYNILRTPCISLTEKLEGCLANTDKLDNWCDFVKLMTRLQESGLRSYIDFAIQQNIDSRKIVLTYKKAFYSQWVDAVLHESPILIELARVPHDEIIERFKEKDTLNFEINKAKIKAKLSAQRPSLDMVAQGSSIAILLREGEKKRKQKGIRQLLSELDELAQTLKPCFLMSPLSVSTFLNPEIKFDVVIFDEASQIFPQDAIGAIYRGKQLIVVGDSKQMPPSNFFNSGTDSDDDDESEALTDFESILDLCSSSFPQRRLKWHYRSRYEQLISFSNKNFYDNDLVTFPSLKMDSKGIGVDYYYVDGVFDRTSKTNQVEAEHIVDLVFENIKKYPNRSLGVVAFSISQQNLIEKLIYKRRQQNAAYEEFFKSDRAEPFFVKNLETVQGDERDTIIFSIAYAKDSQGRLLLNFGPINREGGERRLNVAVTRAKFNVQLVSSMHYYDIDLARTKSVGARLLREYLDYAENGIAALERSISVDASNPFEQYDSEFELEVCEFLREHGFAVDTQVGCSSFKIDLALKRPDSSDYVLAIECDGASYHSSKTARDRDRLRQDILERMGWKFYRIWSTDWFRNKQIEKQRLLDAAKKALENSPVKVSHTEVENDNFSETVIERHFEFPKYKMVDASAIARKYRGDVLSVTRAIVEVESPVSEEWLLKRIVFLFRREKVTNVVRDEFDRYMWNCTRFGIMRKNGFLYSQGSEIPMLRVPADGVEPRDIKYIELRELALGLKEILKQNVSAEKQGLFKLLTQNLGFSRMGDAILERMESALKLIAKDIETNGEMISLK
ncbi:MAG: DUF4011 domain-containing protein [Clostridia bacterium]|nr:DUF4011 domain-containing protein [Clostridia bacterium]